jgi:AAA domain
MTLCTGPPGTGKSTTIFHKIETCVQPDRKVLVTCARDQAVDAITDKLIPLNPLVSAPQLRPKLHKNSIYMHERASFCCSNNYLPLFAVTVSTHDV